MASSNGLKLWAICGFFPTLDPLNLDVTGGDLHILCENVATA